MGKFVATNAVLAYYVGGVRISVKAPDLCVVRAGDVEARMRPGDAIRHGGSTAIKNSGVVILFVSGGFVVRSPKNQPVHCITAQHVDGKAIVLNVNHRPAFLYGYLFDVKVNSKIGVVIKAVERPNNCARLDWWWSVGSRSKDLRVVQANHVVGPDGYEEVRDHEWYI